MKKKYVSWNVNGIRAAAEKGLREYITSCSADLICLQETKAHPEQLDESLINPPGYQSYWTSAEKKGYSGVVIYSKDKPDLIEKLGISEFDSEGRFLALTHGKRTFVGCYFPNSQDGGARIDYKIAFCDAVKLWAEKKIQSGQEVIICGDYNIAPTPMDLARPKENEGNPGFLPQERAWMSQFLDSGWTDTFRHLHPEDKTYSWWSYRFKAKEKNIGWRIDFHCISPNLKERLMEAGIETQVTGSDHVPVWITLKD